MISLHIFQFLDEHSCCLIYTLDMATFNDENEANIGINQGINVYGCDIETILAFASNAYLNIACKSQLFTRSKSEFLSKYNAKESHIYKLLNYFLPWTYKLFLKSEI